MTVCRGEGGERRHNCQMQITIIVKAENGENRDWMDEEDLDLNGTPIPQFKRTVFYLFIPFSSTMG